MLSPARTPRAVLLLNSTSSFISAELGQDCSTVSQAASLPSRGSDLDSCAETVAKHRAKAEKPRATPFKTGL